MSRIDVRKTYKLYIGGQFPRSESGRSYVVNDAKGRLLANAAQASRKDARDAVVAARAAFAGWSGKTAYNRAQVVGNANPVAGPYFNLSTPEPSGVIAVVAPRGALLGLVSVVAPLIITGNTVVVIASEDNPLTAITLGEVMATSDLPGGVVNVLTGSQAEIAPWLASHMDVNGIDLTGVEDAELAVELEVAAADNLKRVRRPAPDTDWLVEPGLDRMTRFLETKTVWHPIGV